MGSHRSMRNNAREEILTKRHGFSAFGKLEREVEDIEKALGAREKQKVSVERIEKIIEESACIYVGCFGDWGNARDGRSRFKATQSLKKAGGYFRRVLKCLDSFAPHEAIAVLGRQVNVMLFVNKGDEDMRRAVVNIMRDEIVRHQFSFGEGSPGGTRMRLTME